jgi:hypothetical protein
MRLQALLLGSCVLFSIACGSTPDEKASSTGAAVGGFPGCSGLFNTNPSPSGKYYATDFGCSSSPYFNDPGDTCGSAACISSGFSEGVCDGSMTDAECQRTVNWYSVGGASYGCGARLQVTNPANGKSVIVMVLDNGPNCSVENDANFWVLDVSYPTIMYLFGSEEGWGDHALIDAVEVSRSMPLGPVTGSSPPPPPPPPPTDAGTTGWEDGGYGVCTISSGASGYCIEKSVCAAHGGTSTAGDCPGPAAIECCTLTSPPPPPTDAGTTSGWEDGGYGTCTTSGGASGYCIEKSVCATHGGTSIAGDCPGPDAVECCTGT